MAADSGTPNEDQEGASLARISGALGVARDRARDLANHMAEIDAACVEAGSWLDTCARIGEIKHELDQAVSEISTALGLRSSKARLRQYFLSQLGEVVSNYQLAGVAGTLEWARRVRELGVEEGWDITTGPEDGLRPGTYRLDADEVDSARAERWQYLNSIRRTPGSAADRCLSLLKTLYPDAASKEELQYVARIQEWPRRMRELEEAGWPIDSSNDDKSLAIGSYRLESLIQGPPRKREAIRLRHEILKRDNWTCQHCGAHQQASARRVTLHVHHKRHVSRGGTNEADNLITLCIACHAGLHAVDEGDVADELLEPGKDPDR